jgi:branched-chain amino acid transport system substrate-binding protein
MSLSKSLRRLPGRIGRGSLVVAAVGVLALLQAAHAEEFKVGAIASLTGPAAGFSKDYADGMKAYVDAWNARGGINGQKVGFQLVDDETNPVNAVNLYRQLSTDPTIKVVWFGGSSNSGMAMKALASELKVPVVSGGGLDKLGLPADPYFFKIVPGTKDFMARVVGWAKANNMKRIATINATDAYGQSEAGYFKDLGKAAGLTVVAAETFTLTDTNFNVQLTKIRNAKPDMVYNGGTGTPGLLIFKQYKQLGITTPLVVSQAAINKAFFDGVGDKALVEGMLTPTNRSQLGAALSGESGKMYKQLSDTIGRPGTLMNAFGWDSGIITEWAIKNSDGTREGIRAALDKAKDVGGINGPLSFTPDNHIGQDHRGIVMMKYSGGRFVSVEKD